MYNKGSSLLIVYNQYFLLEGGVLNMLMAFALIMVGLSFLGLSLGLISADTFSVLWPLLLVFFGVWMMMNGPGALKKLKIKKRK